MSHRFQCSRCGEHLSSKQMLDYHLHKRKKPCRKASFSTSTISPPHNFPFKMWSSTINTKNTGDRLKNNEKYLQKKRLTTKSFKKRAKKFNNFDLGESHDNIPHTVIDEQDFFCSGCHKNFSRIDSLKRHKKKCHEFHEVRSQEVRQIYETGSHDSSDSDSQKHNPQPAVVEKMASEISLLKKKIEEMENKNSEPRVIHQNNQILQILCVGDHQNYLDLLTEEMGDYNRALGFIKDCALSNVNGDCKLLEKIYFSGNNGNKKQPIRYVDRHRKKLAYINKDREDVVDPHGVRLGKILANNLQNSYLQGINYLINQNLENRRCPSRFLDDYDLQSWNKHIYELSDQTYQKKIINSLNIP